MRTLSQSRQIAKFESFFNSIAVDNESFHRAVMAFEVAGTIQSFQAASNAPTATPSVRATAVLTLTAALCAQPLLFVIKRRRLLDGHGRNGNPGCDSESHREG